MKWIVTALALLEAGYMAFDGFHALALGDYVTINGQLGPWSLLVSAIGIEPRSMLMKIIFLVYGIAWMIVAASFALNFVWARAAMLVAAIGSLWYLPIGTLFGIIQIAILLFTRPRSTR